MFKTLLRQIGDYKKDAILTPVFVILEVIMEVIIPIMMAAIIDYGLADQSIGRVVLIGLAMIGAAMLALIQSGANPTLRRVFHEYDELNARAQENVNGMRVVKFFVREEYETGRFET